MSPETRTGEDRPLRRDAVRNRAVILEAAAVVFAQRGLEAGYDEIARRAGVGVGTVYRRFPERAELVAALFESRIDEVVAVAEEAVERDDAWEGLVFFLHRVVELQSADRGLREALALVSEQHRGLIGRDRIDPLLARLVTRAKADGALRHDLEPTDLGVLLVVLSSVTAPDQPDLWRRYLTMAIDGMRARPGQGTLPLQAPSEDVIHDLIHLRHGADRRR